MQMNPKTCLSDRKFHIRIRSSSLCSFKKQDAVTHNSDLSSLLNNFITQTIPQSITFGIIFFMELSFVGCFSYNLEIIYFLKLCINSGKLTHFFP